MYTFDLHSTNNNRTRSSNALWCGCLFMVICLTDKAFSNAEESPLLANLTEQSKYLQLEYDACRTQRDNLAASHNTDTKRISKLQSNLDTLQSRIGKTWVSYLSILSMYQDVTCYMVDNFKFKLLWLLWDQTWCCIPSVSYWVNSFLWRCDWGSIWKEEAKVC